jgi:D-3-phosphoglycerate dehydrogenase
MNEKARVLVKEKIADAGVDLLRESFDVELGLEWDGSELEQRIGDFDGILIRSATKLTPDLIERAERLKVIGRAGTGVDNVDVEAATKRGIVVANAPEANSIAAAEHTMALVLALCRHRPTRHSPAAPGTGRSSRAPSSTARRWECSASGASGSS